LEVEEKDQIAKFFNLNSGGRRVMQSIHLELQKIVGEIKEEIKEAWLEAEIH